MRNVCAGCRAVEPSALPERVIPRRDRQQGELVQAHIRGQADSGNTLRCWEASHGWNFLVSGEYQAEPLSLSLHGLLSDDGFLRHLLCMF